MDYTGQDLRARLSAQQTTGSDPDGSGRRPFETDIDRISFSEGFRLLADKTQVHGLVGNTYTRSRLTHSVEVGRVARSLGRQFVEVFTDRDAHLSEDVQDILQATGLLHDIGNPPFGHPGEDAISAFFRDDPFGQMLIEGLAPAERVQFTHFEGNAQAARFALRLGGWRAEGGLGLSYATLAAFSKYPWAPDPMIGVEKRKCKYGLFASDAALFAPIAAACKMSEGPRMHSWRRHPLAYLSEAADDICYGIVDVEDAVMLGIIPLGEAEELLLPMLSPDQHFMYRTIADTGRKIVFLRSKVISTLIAAVAALLPSSLDSIMDGTHAGNLSRLIPQGEQMARISVFSDRFIYKTDRRLEQDRQAFEQIHQVLKVTAEGLLEREGVRAPTRNAAVGRMLGRPPFDRVGWLHALCDHIIAQTDRSIGTLAEDLNHPQGTLLFP